MSRREKLITAMRNNPKGVAFAELKSLLCYYGCSVRQKSRGSSHYTFTHPAIPYALTIPKDRPVKAVYVKRALAMIDEIEEVDTDGRK